MCGFVARPPRTPFQLAPVTPFRFCSGKKFAIYTLVAVLERLAKVLTRNKTNRPAGSSPMTGDKSNLLLQVPRHASCHPNATAPTPWRATTTSEFAFLLMFAQFKKFSIAICICTHIRTCLCNSKTMWGRPRMGAWVLEQDEDDGEGGRGVPESRKSAQPGGKETICILPGAPQNRGFPRDPFN